jgi:hypothetical protein
MERGVLVQTGSWPCENFSGRATRRNISEQLHLWESNHTAHARFDALLENCVFYISRMYEFSHSVGHSATSTDVRYTAAFGGNADNQPVIAGQSRFMSTRPSTTLADFRCNGRFWIPKSGLQ